MDLLPVFLLEQENVLTMLFLKLTQLETMLIFHLSDCAISFFQVTLF